MKKRNRLIFTSTRLETAMSALFLRLVTWIGLKMPIRGSPLSVNSRIEAEKQQSLAFHVGTFNPRTFVNIEKWTKKEKIEKDKYIYIVYSLLIVRYFTKISSSKTIMKSIIDGIAYNNGTKERILLYLKNLITTFW